MSQSVLAGESPFSPASMASLSAFPGMGLMSGFSKLPLGMPFGALPNFSMSNPMLGLTGFMPGLSPLGKESESKKEKHSPSSKKESSSSRHESKSPSSSQTPHPSFPMLYNPLMLMSNPLLAAQAQAGLNFSLPSSLPSSFAALAQSGLMNGKGDSDLEDREPGEVGRFARGDPKDQEMAQDLSVRVEAHSHHSKRRHMDSSSERSKERRRISSIDEQDQPTDLSMKSKPKESPVRESVKDYSEPKDYTKKNKIQGSFKLNKIVDTLKDKVNKMEDRGQGSGVREKKDKKSKLDSILMKIAKEKDVSVSALNEMEVMDTSAKGDNSAKLDESVGSVNEDLDGSRVEMASETERDSS